MDNGARLPLYAGARLGEGTHSTRMAWWDVGISVGKAAVRWDAEGSLLGKDWFSLERKSFQMELGLAKPSSHPSPSLRRG